MALPYSPNWNRVSTSTGYQVVYCPDHPRAWSTGYVYVHIVIAEQKIGRLLQPGEVVHHKNRNRLDNSPDNLEVYESQAAHRLEHSKDKQETLVPLKCSECGRDFNRRKGNEPSIKGYKQPFCSKSCNGKYQIRKRRSD